MVVSHGKYLSSSDQWSKWGQQGFLARIHLSQTLCNCNFSSKAEILGFFRSRGGKGGEDAFEIGILVKSAKGKILLHCGKRLQLVSAHEDILTNYIIARFSKNLNSYHKSSNLTLRRESPWTTSAIIAKLWEKKMFVWSKGKIVNVYFSRYKALDKGPSQMAGSFLSWWSMKINTKRWATFLLVFWEGTHQKILEPFWYQLKMKTYLSKTWFRLTCRVILISPRKFLWLTVFERKKTS